MSGTPFWLIPFPGSEIPEISVGGTYSFAENILDLHYRVKGKTENISIPAVSENPSRKDDLWKSTCFEFFLTVDAQPGYWEFNMSPSGDWNVYRMEAYRKVGFREERSIQQFSFNAQKQASVFTLDATIDLTPLVQPSQALKLGITAVIQTSDGNETFWALAHPAPVADFHLRESFILDLAGAVSRS